MKPNPDSIAHILLFSGGLALRELVHRLNPISLVRWVLRRVRHSADDAVESKIENVLSPRCKQSPAEPPSAQQIAAAILWLDSQRVRPNGLGGLMKVEYRIDLASIPAPEPLQDQYDPTQSSTPSPSSPNTLVIHSLQRYAELVKAGKLPSLGQSLKLPLPVDTDASHQSPAEQTASGSSLTDPPKEVLPDVPLMNMPTL